jgi:hypothetical protein
VNLGFIGAASGRESDGDGDRCGSANHDQDLSVNAVKIAAQSVVREEVEKRLKRAAPHG